MNTTLGISPKVYIPALLQIVVGVILLLTGSDVEGKTLLLSAVGTFGAGFASPNAPVLTVGTDDPVGNVDPTDPTA